MSPSLTEAVRPNLGQKTRDKSVQVGSYEARRFSAVSSEHASAINLNIRIDSVYIRHNTQSIYEDLSLCRQAPSTLSSNPCTSFTALFLSRRASSHSPSALIASRRSRLCSRSSPSRTCSCARSTSFAGAAFPLAAVGLSAGCGGAAEDVAVPWRADKKRSTSGCNICRTLSSSVRICLTVVSSVRLSGAAFLDGSELSPPPMTAIFDFSLIPYAETTCDIKSGEEHNEDGAKQEAW